ncbi:MAG: DUF533 domain-containing protein, partial [Pirellula sp.]
AGGAGPGADFLNEILGGRPSPSSQAAPGGRRSADSTLSPEQLEDVLAIEREHASSRQAPSQPQTRQPQTRQPQTRQPQQREMPRNAPPTQSTQFPTEFPTDIFGRRQRQEPKINLSVPKPSPLSQNDQAVLLIRAMINSAKVDGEITEDEQRKILEQVGDTSPETIQFLRAEFGRPLDITEYAESLPIGMEQKAYAISLLAIKLDTKEEADYLRQLARSLRILPDVCNQIHQQQNAPLMYQA